MDNINNYSKTSEMILLEKGIGNNNIFLYLKDKYFYIQHNYLRCFKFSLRRAKNTLNKDINILLKIFIKYFNNIILEKQNENLFYLSITYPSINNKNFISKQKIKLKEINNYLYISKQDNLEIIIKKQDEKINLLLNKIEEYEKKYNECDTDDELFLNII